ncbi:MAG: lipoprotein-releasing ABC transporter permease subunit [Alphaproteobacteria bacterium]|nr:lipoprotein-releasing ABC transporter permease subunit [Alphaproteobacteria bacterium]
MFSAFERKVAFRYLRSRKKGFVSVIAGFSLLGIALGVATLIIVMAVMNGFREELLSKVLGLNGHIGVYSKGGRPIMDYRITAAELARIQGVEKVTPIIEGQVMASANGQSIGAMVRGVEGKDLRARDIIASNIVRGTLDEFDLGSSVIIGYRMAEKLGLMAGNNITLISPNGHTTAFGTVPRMRSYRIAGIFNVGMYEYDSSFIFMPMKEARTYFRMPKGVSNLEVILNNSERLDDIILEAAPIVGANGYIHSWKDSNATFFAALQTERNVMFIILTLIILVAAFNIISGLIMLVKDKGRDIAVLRTMGATRQMIMRIFLLSGSCIGFTGTFAGLGLGLVFCDNIESIRRMLEKITGTDLFADEIYFLSKLPAIVDTTEVTAIVIMALTLSFIATLLPSWQAAKLDPVEALRYE